MRIWKIVTYILTSFILVVSLHSCTLSQTLEINRNNLFFDGDGYWPTVEKFVQDIDKSTGRKQLTKNNVIFSIETNYISSGYIVKVVKKKNPKMYYFFLIYPDGEIGGENKVVGAIQVDLSGVYIANGEIRIPSAFSRSGTYKFASKLSLIGYTEYRAIAFQIDPFNPLDIAKENFRANQFYIKLTSPKNFEPSNIVRLDLETSRPL